MSFFCASNELRQEQHTCKNCAVHVLLFNGIVWIFHSLHLYSLAEGSTCEQMYGLNRLLRDENQMLSFISSNVNLHWFLYHMIQSLNSSQHSKITYHNTGQHYKSLSWSVWWMICDRTVSLCYSHGTLSAFMLLLLKHVGIQWSHKYCWHNGQHHYTKAGIR